MFEYLYFLLQVDRATVVHRDIVIAPTDDHASSNHRASHHRTSHHREEDDDASCDDDNEKTDDRSGNTIAL